MIVESISLKNFLSHADTTVSFEPSPMWLVCGENGAGKSALFDALEYALYGQHRGGTQNANLLVKHGRDRAVVQVVVRLGETRYRLTRQIHATRGNIGGSVEEWRDDVNDWQPCLIGNGVQAAWEWLARRLPSHDLFRSAIFLRQGETAHFLGNLSAGDRMKRFATLIGLDRYSEVATRARERAVAAREQRRDAEQRLRDLRDVSDDALAEAERQAAEAKAAEAKARAAVDAAAAVLAGAEQWQALLNRAADLELRRATALRLLDDEATIIADAERVKAWDEVATTLDRYHRARADERAAHDEAARARTAAAQAHTARAELAVTLTDLHVQLDAGEAEAPAAKARQAEAERRLRALELEVAIADAHARMRTAEEKLKHHHGADAALAKWKQRQGALPYVRRYVTAREALTTAEHEQRVLLDGIERERAALAEAEQTAATADGALARQVEQDRNADAKVRELADAVAMLRGRIESHGRLAGGEPECPVCVRPLDAGAHAHVRTVLAEEQARLAAVEREGKAAVAARNHAAVALTEAQQAATRAATELATVRARLKAAETDSDRSARQVARAAAEVEEARQAIAVDYPAYLERIDGMTADTLRIEDASVRRALPAAHQAAEALAEARGIAATAEGALRVLRTQRADVTDPVGDTRTAEEVRRLAGEARRAADEAAAWVEQLTARINGLKDNRRRLMQEDTRLHERERHQSEQADRLTRQAEAAAAAAAGLAAVLDGSWSEALADEAGYQRQKQAIDERRTSAARITDLAKARGQIEQLDRELALVMAERDQAPVDHRVPLAEAQSARDGATTEHTIAGRQHARAENDLADLRQRREQAACAQATISAAGVEEETHQTLYELLREGGPVQNEVARQEQRAIAEEVNAVLRRLNDRLEVQISAARRQRGAVTQDIAIVDTSDPAAVPRHFEFLSGGEQFRVALALALALHRRVGHTAGTLIVDEGFGALDSVRRDALAEQMTEQTRGILALGLAGSIIICSHAAEVQRHFAYRWLVEKRDGVATARRPRLNAYDEHEDGSEPEAGAVWPADPVPAD